jgi:hypothetical protein
MIHHPFENIFFDLVIMNNNHGMLTLLFDDVFCFRFKRKQITPKILLSAFFKCPILCGSPQALIFYETDFAHNPIFLK